MEAHINFCNSIPMASVQVTDPYYMNALKKEIDYLESLDPDRLLAGFHEVKGSVPKAAKYGGWETSEIQGHTLGHYCTALAQAYNTIKDGSILNRIEYIIQELTECQRDDGYLFASREEYFDRVENQVPVWVPWYTMHKIMEGLISVSELTPLKSTIPLLSRLADWIAVRTGRWDEEQQNIVLKVEYGGMNDCLYDTYLITGKQEHLQAAHMFDETALFDEIHSGNDILCDLHANTTIPKFVGAMKRYMVLGEEEVYYLEAAERFWDMVVHHHSYVTGGNSEWEHFGKPDILDAERSQYTCETCNTYNMLKLSKGLFMITGKKGYLDFYDSTLTNAILPTQNPETGMTMYFQPMATGYFKVYSTPFDKFWCCTGTGMENFTKLNDAIFFEKESELIISRYVSTEFQWKQQNLYLSVQAPLPFCEKPEIRIRFENPGDTSEFSLSLRIPGWCSGLCTLMINNESHFISAEEEADGFISIRRKWEDGDIVTLSTPMSVSYQRPADNPNAVAFLYGPYVLSAGMGAEALETSWTGVNVDIPTRNIDVKNYINLRDKTVDEWLEELSLHLVKKPDTLEFSLKGTDEDNSLVFEPYYLHHDGRYGIYWYLFGTDSDLLRKEICEKEQAKQELEKATIDRIPIGNDQYELKHTAEGENTCSDTYNGYKFREARPGGWFSYAMKLDPDSENVLRLEYVKTNLDSKGEVYAGDTLISTMTVPGIHPPEFAVEEVLIPRKLTEGQTEITVKFVNLHEKHGFRIAGILRMLKCLESGWV